MFDPRHPDHYKYLIPSEERWKWSFVWICFFIFLYLIFKLNDQGKPTYFGEGRVVECKYNPSRFLDDNKRHKNVVMVESKGRVSTIGEACFKNLHVTVELRIGVIFRNKVYESKKT